ncbi:MAG: response regulator transcription factor [Candidatus Obscuribacterales bacterium]|nr:response regulator transcription factor [Candidatus Obscuribacterales bacterium]
MPKILIVDDDESLCWLLKNLFEDVGYHVDLADSIAAARLFTQQFTYDAMILDWDLGDGAGTNLLKQLRITGFSTPCLMLTGRRDEASCEFGLVEAGADDYLTKPFSSVELKARIQALTRRRGAFHGDRLSAGNLTLSRPSATVSYGDRSANLHKHEFLILELLMKNPGEFFTAESMLARLWSSESEVSLDNVRVQMSRLRKKLREIAAEALLETERGLGYRLVLQTDAAKAGDVLESFEHPNT